MSSVRSLLQVSILGKEGFEDVPAETADLDHLLDDLERGESFDLGVQPVDPMIQYPRMHINWHLEHGFVVMVFENEDSIGSYPIVGAHCGQPEVQIELGGQALEKWPRELFVPRATAARALQTFVKTGRQDGSFTWVANNAFEREILWETRAEGIAWEKKQRQE